MTPRIALQLYSVREALARDFAGAMRRVAATGYRAVETAGFPQGTSPQAAAALFRELGLEVMAAHSPLPLGEKRNEVLDTMAALGCPRLLCPWEAPETFANEEGIRGLCDRLNEASRVAAAAGLSLGYHNHWFEYEPRPPGRPGYQVMLEHLDPAVFLEVDVYWVKVAGLDPVAVLNELGPRASLLHIKDGPLSREQPMTALGAGQMDLPPILAASQAAWHVVELDRCATDMLAAVAQSYAYLAGVSR